MQVTSALLRRDENEFLTAINYHPGLIIVLSFKPIESLRLHMESRPNNWVNVVKYGGKMRKNNL